jgi:hypothetical protein
MSDSEKSGSEDSLEIETSRFNSRTKKEIRAFYGNCCAFCLTILTVEAMECAEILDASGEGASQVCIEQSFLFEMTLILCPSGGVLRTAQYHSS